MDDQRPGIGLSASLQPGTIAVTELKRVWAEVIFGSRDRNCRGNGICKVVTLRGPEDAGRQQRLCRRAIGWVARPAPGCLVLSFDEPALCPHLIRHQFRDDLFKVSTPALLPASLRRQLGLKGRWISRGVYPVSRRAGRLEFTVAVRRLQH